MTNRRKIGSKIELIAEKYLQRKGFKIIEKNFTIWGGEIDIIARYKDEIVFVEVKGRKNEHFLALEESISESKRRYLIRASEVWLKKHALEASDWRIDFIGILYDEGKVKEIRHYESAIYN